MQEQTIWLATRTTSFTEICATCHHEYDDRGGPPPTVSGRLELGHAAGWATCRRGHTIRVLRMRALQPSGAVR